MMPVVPDWKPPCHSMVETFGFQSPQVDMSDQIFQTLSAEAVLSTDVPYSAMPEILASERLVGCKLEWGLRLHHHRRRLLLGPAEHQDHGHQQHRPHDLRRVDGLVEAPGIWRRCDQ